MAAQRGSTKQTGGTAPAKPPTSTPKPVASQPAARPTTPKKGDPVEQSWVSTRLAGVRQLSRDTWSEMKKVNWPDQETTRNLTVLVIALSVVLGLLLGGIDFLLLKLFSAIS